MAKDKHDLDSEDWVDDVEERREREIQEHARRQARKEKYLERKTSSAPSEDRAHSRTAR